MPKLIEELLTLAEVLELKCDPSGLSEGAVIESQVDVLKLKCDPSGLSEGAVIESQVDTLK